jgi:hypothetical protein
LRWSARVTTPAYLRIVRDREAVYSELVRDRRFRFSQDRAARQLKRNRDRDVVEAFIGIVVRRVRATGETDVERVARVAFTGPNLALSTRNRARGVVEAVKAVQLGLQERA